MKRDLFLRGICLLLIFSALTVGFIPTASASSFDAGLPDAHGASNVYFSNLDSGRVLLAKSPNKRIVPASTVKIMTGLLALEYFEGRTDTAIEVTAQMLSASEGTSMKLMAGDIVTVHDLVLGVICGGYNDAAYVLAHAVAGNARDFVAMMNERAAELGAKNTHYENPTGWDTDGAYTTAGDVALIAKAAMKNQAYMELSSVVSEKVKPINSDREMTVHNRNALIGSYYAEGYTNRYAEGMIAGMTDAGGYCVVSRFVIKGASYLCVVMGATEQNGTLNSFALANELSAYARTNLGFVEIASAGERICEVPVDLALFESSEKNEDHTVKTCLGADVSALLPLDVDVAGEITLKHYLYTDRLTAPLSEGDRVGGVDFYYGDEIVASAPLVVCSDVAANEIVITIEDLRSTILGRTSAISAVIFVVLFSLWFYFFDYKKRRKRTRKITYRNY